MKCTVKVVPASGKGSEKSVTYEGPTVKEVLKAAGLDDKNMNVTVDGEPAADNAYVPDGATVVLTEKARGS